MSRKEDTSIFYKLRDKSTGLYSAGVPSGISAGAKGHWNETGKSWGKIGWVKNSIRQATHHLERKASSSYSSDEEVACARARLQYILDNWEIIEVVTKMSELSSTPVGELIEFKMGEEDDRTQKNSTTNRSKRSPYTVFGRDCIRTDHNDE
jgi:hypothetical protein